MAALTQEAARIRAEAARSRVASLALRAEVRRQAEECRARISAADRSCLWAQRLRSGGVPTAWSSLRWSPPGRDLDAVLEIVA